MKYIVKTDISGIQKFIFDIPSKGAAKQLKARSFYVYATTHIILKMLQDSLGKDSVEVIYNGGGNLFVYANTERETLEEFRKKIEQEKFQGVLFPFVSFVEVQDDFKTTMQSLSNEVLKMKLKRNFNNTPFEENKSINWDKFIKQLVERHGFEIKRGKATDEQISLGDYVLEFSGNNLDDTILNKVPKNDNGNITEFEVFAEKSLEDGADKKIAALKMDVDNLGSVFRNKEEAEYRRLSQAIENFFSKELYHSTLKDRINNKELYPVFAGGDDLFFVGSWHKMIDIAQEINTAFNKFQKTLNLEKKLTLSGSIIIAHSKYPLIRIAEEAENALELAKNYRVKKDSICILGQPMGWEELEECRKIKERLFELVNEKGESKAILHRIRASDLGFRSIQDKILKNNKIEIPKVYRLKYYLRNAKNEENRKILEEIFSKYSEDLLNDFLNTKKSNPAKYIVATRWTELLLRNKK